MAKRCVSCGGLLDPLSKQATQNQMGPWRVRGWGAPELPGCSYAVVRKMVASGVIEKETVLRGPTTRQFWVRASRAPGVAHLVGVCHACGAPAGPDDFECGACRAPFWTPEDRNTLGIGPVRLAPGQASADEIARTVLGSTPEDPRAAAQSAQAAQAGQSAQAVAGKAVAGRGVQTTAEQRRTNTFPEGSHGGTPGGTARAIAVEPSASEGTLRVLQARLRWTRRVVVGLSVLNGLALLLLVALLSDRLWMPGERRVDGAEDAAAPKAQSNAGVE